MIIGQLAMCEACRDGSCSRCINFKRRQKRFEESGKSMSVKQLIERVQGETNVDRVAKKAPPAKEAFVPEWKPFLVLVSAPGEVRPAGGEGSIVISWEDFSGTGNQYVYQTVALIRKSNHRVPRFDVEVGTMQGPPMAKGLRLMSVRVKVLEENCVAYLDDQIVRATTLLLDAHDEINEYLRKFSEENVAMMRRRSEFRKEEGAR